MKKVSLLVFSLILGAAPLMASSTDSLLVVLQYESNSAKKAKIYYQIAREKVLSSDENAGKLMDSLAPFIEAHAAQETIAHFYNLNGYYHFYSGKYGKAFFAYTMAVQSYQDLDDFAVQQGQCMKILGRLQLMRGNYEACDSLYQKAAIIFLRANNSEELADLHYHRGYFHASQDQLSEAQAEFQLALGYYEQQGITRKIIDAMNEVGRIHRRMGNPELATATFQQAWERANGLGQEHDEIKGYVRNNQGLLALDQNDYEKAQWYFEKAISYVSNPQNPQRQTHIVNLARAFQSQGEYTKTTELLNHAIGQFEAKWKSKDRLSAYDFLVEAYEAQGDIAMALAKEKERASYMIAKQDADALATDARMISEIEAAEARLTNLDLKAQSSSANQRYWIILISIMVAAIVISFLFYRRMMFYRKEAWRHATNWPELQKKMDALEETLGMLG